MIPRNIFLMWDKPMDAWPALVRTCIDLWIEINPGWNVEVFDASRAQELISTDIDIEIYKSLRVQHQSDLVRTKLLGSRGGIWADASCLPHFSVDKWIGEFDDLDFSAIKTLQVGQVADNWFMLSRENGVLMTKHYRTLVRYWATAKINMPQDPRSISMMADNWQSFISDYSARILRIAPYFCWHYLFRNQVETDSEFGEVFGKQRYLSESGECGALIRMLRRNMENGVENNPMPAEMRRFLMNTDSQLSKLNHHSLEINYPLDEFREVILERNS